MSNIIHYLMLILIVLLLAEIRTVLVYDIPYENDPITIWNESATNPELESQDSPRARI